MNRFLDSPLIKGKHVMLTRRIEFDVAQQNHFIVLPGAKLSDEDFLRALFVASVNFFPRTNDPGRSLLQTFPIWIFTNSNKNFAD
jgi:hypothetical protein